MLEIGYEAGDDRVLLFLPWVSKHVIDENSPLANWLEPNGMMADSDSMIAVTVSLTRSIQYVLVLYSLN